MLINDVLTFEQNRRYTNNVRENVSGDFDKFLDRLIMNEAPFTKKSQTAYGPVLSRRGKTAPAPQKKSSGMGGAAAGVALAALGGINGASDFKYVDGKEPQAKYASYQDGDSDSDKKVTLKTQDGRVLQDPVPEPIKKTNTEAKPNASEKKPFYKIGSQYTINGVSYKPHYNPEYNKTGIASWYGAETKGKYTANHSKFDYSEITAAHPTLPIPSKVLVTNLENGKQIMVTVNDRGPFANNRIIDLTQAAAQQLGFKDKGTAKVRVEYDKKATEAYLKKNGLFDQYQKVALNQTSPSSKNK